MNFIRGVFTSEHFWTGLVVVFCFVLGMFDKLTLQTALGMGIAVMGYSIARGLSKFNLNVEAD